MNLPWNERLRLVRSRLSLDQEAMGRELGVSREWVSKLERGKEEPSELLQRKIVDQEAKAGLPKSEPSFTAEEVAAKFDAAIAKGPQSIFAMFDARHLEIIIQAVVDMRLKKAQGQRDRLATLLEDLLRGEPATIGQESAVPPRGTLIAMLTMLANDPTTFAALAAKAAGQQDSSENAAVIDAKHRGRERGFRRAAEILAAEAAAAHGAGEAKSG